MVKDKICLACGTLLDEREGFCPVCGAMAGTEEPCHRCGAATEEAGYVKGCMLLVCTKCGYVESDENRPDFRLEDGGNGLSEEANRLSQRAA